MDRFTQRAFAMMRSPKVRSAFDLTQESGSINKMFDESSFAQSCLLATRLVETGVRFVTLSYGGWDHARRPISRGSRILFCPRSMLGLAGLFRALEAKGLLALDHRVCDRRIRPHAAHQRARRSRSLPARHVLLDGGRRNTWRSCIGQQRQARAMGPEHQPITPDDVAATFYRTLGIDIRKEYKTPSGRPVMIVRNGNPIAELVA